jgi:hypothetical protein
VDVKKTWLGILFGSVAGIIDVIPMVFQKLTWDANLSAFSLWIVSGFLIATTDIKVRGAIKGIIIPFAVLLPSAVLIGWREPSSLIPVFIMTLLIGAGLGFVIDKWGE